MANNEEIINSIQKIQKDHCKFVNQMEEKQNYLAPIFHWLSQNNIRAATNAIDQQTEPVIILDLIKMMMTANRMNNISIEFCTILVKKAIQQIESKYMIHIKTGTSFVIKSIQLFFNDIVGMNVGNPAQANVKKREMEEKPKEYKQFLDQVHNLYNSSRLAKILHKYEQQEVGKLCLDLYYESERLLKQIGMLN